jgi:hypothetical protein
VGSERGRSEKSLKVSFLRSCEKVSVLEVENQKIYSSVSLSKAAQKRLRIASQAPL